MKSKWVNYLALLVLLLLAGVAALNLFLFLRPEQRQTVLQFNDVRGMAVEYEGLLYTLNFDQQNGVVKALNTPQESKAPLPVYFTKLVIYRFNQDDLVYPAADLARNPALLNILSTAYDVKTTADPKYHPN